MNRTRGKKRPMAEINVVPYIDVMMVLLVIFIATAPVVMQGVSVDLPQAESKAMDENQKVPFICSVDKEGRYFTEFSGSHHQVANLEELTQEVQTQLAREPKTPIVVQGDASARYDNVIQLMNALKMAGVENVGLVTEPVSNSK